MAICGYLRQSTAVTLKVGPFLDATDGVTAEDSLTISQGDVRLSKNGGNMAQKNEATSATHDEVGMYDVPLDATDTNTLGNLVLNVAEAGAIPVKQEYLVVTANVWDTLFSTDRFDVEVAAIAANAITATSIATDAITSAKIANGAIASGKLGTNAIQASNVTAATLTAAKFGAGAVDATALASDAVTKIWTGRTGVTSLAKNVAVTNFPVHMRLTAGGNGTGLTVTGEISKDGGAFAGLTDATITEIGTTGIYVVDVSQTEMNADWCVFRFTATGCSDTVIVVRTQA